MNAFLVLFYIPIGKKNQESIITQDQDRLSKINGILVAREQFKTSEPKLTGDLDLEMVFS